MNETDISAAHVEFTHREKGSGKKEGSKQTDASAHTESGTPVSKILCVCAKLKKQKLHQENFFLNPVSMSSGLRCMPGA